MTERMKIWNTWEAMYNHDETPTRLENESAASTPRQTIRRSYEVVSTKFVIMFQLVNTVYIIHFYFCLYEKIRRVQIKMEPYMPESYHLVHVYNLRHRELVT